MLTEHLPCPRTLLIELRQPREKVTMLSALWVKQPGSERCPVIPLQPHRVGDRSGGLSGSPLTLSFPGLLPRGPLLLFLVYSLQTFSCPMMISHLNELSHLFSIIYSFTQYLLNSYCIPGAVLGGRDRMGNKARGERHKKMIT